MGEVFAGRYELIDPIGRGGVGAVWRSWDHRRRRYVAAKVLQQSDAHSLLRFVREQALRIDHPHVLAPASWAADDDKVLFTMDLVSGGSLTHLVADYGPLPPPHVAVLLDQLLSGLQAVHEEGVVHRDIKPANVLLENTGRGRPHLRLSDFGISMRKGEPRLTETNFVMGTPGYFAPEQLRGAEPDYSADQYPAGLVALYLLTGTRPDSAQLLDDFAQGRPPAPGQVPDALWQVLATLLQPDPEARFRSVAGARKALVQAAELLPDVTQADPIAVFDQIGPLPAGFGHDGPVQAGAESSAPGAAGAAAAADGLSASETGSFHLPPPHSAPLAGVQGPPGQPEPSQSAVPGEPPYAPHAPHVPHAPPVAAAHAPQQPGNPRGSTSPTLYEQPTSAQPASPTSGNSQQQSPPPPPPAPGSYASHPAPGALATAIPSTAALPTSARRPGPPLKLAVPALILAVGLIAFGIWQVVTA